MDTDFRITGRHVLFTLLGFFLVILAVNMIFLNFAVRTFPGEKEKKSYLQGLNYNDRLASRAAQDALGWSAAIEEAVLTDGTMHLAITMKTRSGAPVNGLAMSAVLSRPADDAQDQPVAFNAIGGGRYETAAPAGPGAWNLDAVAVNARGDEFVFTSRLILE